jgi:hypothetical protein
MDESQRIRLDEGQRLRIESHLEEFTRHAERLFQDAQRARELFAQGHLSNASWLINLSESIIGQLQAEHDELLKTLEASGVEPSP